MELGLRPDHRGGGPIPGQEPEADPRRELGDDRRAGRRGGGRRVDAADVNQVLAQDERPPVAVRLVALPPGRRKVDRVRVFALGVKPSCQHLGVAAALYVSTSRSPQRVRPEVGRDGVDPGDQRADEPRHGGNGRRGLQAVSALRAAAPASRLAPAQTAETPSPPPIGSVAAPAYRLAAMPEEAVLEAEAVEEPAADDAGRSSRRPGFRSRRHADVEAWRGEVRTAAIAAAGGLVAGAATVAVCARCARPAPRRQRSGRLLSRATSAEHDRQPVVPGRRPHPRRPVAAWRAGGAAAAAPGGRGAPPWPYRLPRSGGGDAVMRVRRGIVTRLLHVDGEPSSSAPGSGGKARCGFGRMANGREPASGIERMRFALGVDDDYRELYDRFRSDRLLGGAIRRALAPAAPPPVAMGGAGLGDHQQLIESSRAAEIQRRIVLRWGSAPAGPDGAMLRDLPTPALIAGRAPAELAAMDLAPARALALIRAAREVAAGRVDPADPARRRLLAIREIGPWTVQCLALYGRGEPDSLPAGDLAYIKLVGRLAGLGRRATIEEVEEFFAPYAPYRGLAASFILAAHYRASPRARLCAWPRELATDEGRPFRAHRRVGPHGAREGGSQYRQRCQTRRLRSRRPGFRAVPPARLSRGLSSLRDLARRRSLVGTSPFPAGPRSGRGRRRSGRRASTARGPCSRRAAFRAAAAGAASCAPRRR